jgi:hypothetical protein
MTDQFETFLSFSDQDLAGLVAEKLQKSNIEFIIEKSKPLLDASLVDTSIDQNFHIKLRRTDFQTGHKALEDYYQAQLENVDKDYYLLSFSTDELKEIVAKPDEWGHFDFQLAQKLLKERGHEIDSATLIRLKEDRIRELGKPEKAGRLLLFFGYCFIPFGVIVGFLIGRHIFYSKRTLPNGQMIFSYRESDRKHGNRIMIISGVIFILSIVFWIIVKIKEN